jgi:hypothetical protein
VLPCQLALFTNALLHSHILLINMPPSPTRSHHWRTPLIDVLSPPTHVPFIHTCFPHLSTSPSPTLTHMLSSPTHSPVSHVFPSLMHSPHLHSLHAHVPFTYVLSSSTRSPRPRAPLVLLAYEDAIIFVIR